MYKFIIYFNIFSVRENSGNSNKCRKNMTTKEGTKNKTKQKTYYLS